MSTDLRLHSNLGNTNGAGPGYLTYSRAALDACHNDVLPACRTSPEVFDHLFQAIRVEDVCTHSDGQLVLKMSGEPN